MGAYETFGTCDRFFKQGDEGVMIDYKSGWSPIDDPEINVQTQAYVLGAFQKFPDINKIHFYFLVPQRDEILFSSYDRSDMPRLSLRLSTIIARAEKEIPELNPQPSACEFCAKQGSCRALASKILVIGREYSEDGMALPENLHSYAIETPEQAGHMLSVSRILRDAVCEWADGVSNRAREMAFVDGLEIPGFKKLTINRTGKILSTLGAWDTLKDSMSLEDFLACADPSLTKLKEFASSRAKRGQKGKAATIVEETLRDAGVLADGGFDQQLRVNRNETK